MQVHEEGRHDEEQRVGDGVEEFGDDGRERVVLLAPVHGRGAPVQVVLVVHGEVGH